MAASGIASWINYDETGKAVFFRAKDGSGYNLDKRTQTWMRAGYVNGMTTAHVLEFASIYKSKEARDVDAVSNAEARQIAGQ